MLRGGRSCRDATGSQVAIDADGDAVVTWCQSDGSLVRLYAALRRAGRGFAAPRPVSPTDVEVTDCDQPTNAVAVWNRVQLWGTAVEVAVRPAGGSFGPARQLSTPVPAEGYVPPAVHYGGPARVAVDDRGNAIVVWSERDGGRKRVFAAARPASGEFGRARALSAPGQHAGAARIAFDAAGDAVAVWRRRSDATGRFQIQAAVRPAGRDFGPAQGISADGQRARAPQLAIDATIVWRRFDGAHWRIQTARSTSGVAE